MWLAAGDAAVDDRSPLDLVGEGCDGPGSLRSRSGCQKESEGTVVLITSSIGSPAASAAIVWTPARTSSSA